MIPHGEIAPDPVELDVYSWRVFDSAGELVGCGRTFPRWLAVEDLDHALRATIAYEREQGEGVM